MIILFLAGPVLAERGLVIWDMAYTITMAQDKERTRTEFFSLLSAPKGDASKRITKVYFYAWEVLYNNKDSQLRPLLADMHSRGLKVYAMAGDPSWADNYRETAEWFCQRILNYNSDPYTRKESRFDGICFDIEPYALSHWESSKYSIWTNYMAMSRVCYSKVRSYNQNMEPSVEWGQFIPFWYDTDGDAITKTEELQTNMDFVAIMDYTVSANNLISYASNECGYAAQKGKYVDVAVETRSNESAGVTFWKSGNNSYMESILAQAGNPTTGLGKYSSFRGFTVHNYENRELVLKKSYRWFSPASPEQHNNSPVTHLDYPVGNEGIGFYDTIEVRWTNIELDAETVSGMRLQVSSNNGSTWKDIPGFDGVDDGRYSWDVSGITPGSNYRIKVSAWDSSSHTNYDLSDYRLCINMEPAVNPDPWTDEKDMGNKAWGPQMEYDRIDTNRIHAAYYLESWDGRGIFYKSSSNAGSTWDYLR
ncbi:MAG: fibronectin type III domain-containing protein, partial [bacterium]|nr:fibronectin type III domain-containing protein [bacterium]